MRGRAVAAAAVLALGGLAPVGPATAQQPADRLAPRFQVDPRWPKPLPHHWVMGQAAGVAVDRHDHIWVVQRPRTLTGDEPGAVRKPGRTPCCAPPPVLEFDVRGNLLQAWGGPGPGYDWPLNEHGIYVDADDHVWTLRRDSGTVLGTFGRPGREPGQFHWVHNLAVDSKGNIYTTEVDTGKRAQKFVFLGTFPVEK